MRGDDEAVTGRYDSRTLPAIPMPNSRDPDVREARTDVRVARTTHALGRALIELLEDRPFESVTVQDILDRAGVGRTAFYAHYRNKEDVLFSSYERLFLGMEKLLGPMPGDRRLFPVTELLAHVGESPRVVDALRRDGRMDEVWDECAGHAARLIARRLEESGTPHAVPTVVASRMLAGALVELIRWWLDHQAAATPRQVDALFHQLAAQGVR
jgi:AcrR family transcriptional regulator